jgi:hypothetical protein
VNRRGGLSFLGREKEAEIGEIWEPFFSAARLRSAPLVRLRLPLTPINDILGGELDMKKRILLMILAAIMSLSCFGCAADTSNAVNAADTEAPIATDTEPPASLFVSLGPLEFVSIQEFVEAVSAAKDEITDDFDLNFAELIEMYNFADLTFYYEPSYLPETTQLDYVTVKDAYVALWYNLGLELPEVTDGRQRAINEGLNTVIFTWFRYADGNEFLRNSVERQELTRLGETDVYYNDNYFESETYLGRQYWWVQDGYMFRMYLPVSVLQETFNTQVLLKEL